MDIVDEQIGYLSEIQEKRKVKLWIISALGQDAVKNESKPETILENESKFIKILNLESSKYDFLPAMHPDLNIKCKDKNHLIILRNKCSDITDENGEKLIIERYEPINNTINFTTESTLKLIQSKTILFNNKSYSLGELGLNLIKRDVGTAYHIKKGIFISNQKDDNFNLKVINTTFFHNYLKDYFLNH